MESEILTGLISVIIGFIGLIYIFITLFRLKGEFRKGYFGVTVGLILGYVTIVLTFLSDLSIIKMETLHYLTKYLLGFAAIAIAFGSWKMAKVISYIPPAFFKAIERKN